MKRDKNIYKWNAEDYHKSSAEQRKWARELILKLALNGSERVLDIGRSDAKLLLKSLEIYQMVQLWVLIILKR